MKQILKTTLLLSLLSGLFLAIGYMLGGRNGMTLALAMAAVFNVGTYWFSDKIVLKMQGAKPLDEAKHSNVVRIIRELTAVDGLPMPKLYIVDTPVPNAFATGRSPQHAAVAVTTGILNLINDKELKAVLSHELGHVKNRDMLVSTVAATVAGAITYLAHILMFAGGSDDDRGNPLAGLMLIFLAPLAATLIQLAVSRSREYLADEHAFEVTGSGKELASALEKLNGFKKSHKIISTSKDQATAHLMFANMFNASSLMSLFSTHPAFEARVARLKELDPTF